MTTTYNFDVSISSAVNANDETGEADRQETVVVRPLTPTTLGKIERYWQAANYLTVAQIYLLDNPLLREPLQREHIKPRLLGHWGTSPGLSLIYVHLNRLINERDANVIYLTGPGHGGPALVALAYLEGTYSEVYPEVAPDMSGLRHLCRRFSTPGGIPSHVSVQTPGSIHEGGELGYVLSHAFGAAFDNPDLIVAAVVGDGEAESARWPVRGKARASSTPPATVRYCPSCTSTATRSADRQCWAATVTTTFAPCCRATATRSTSWKGTTPSACTRLSPPPSTVATSVSVPFKEKPVSAGYSSVRAGPPSSCARQRAGQARRW